VAAQVAGGASGEGAASALNATSTTIVATVVTALNLILMVAVVLYCGRRLRRRNDRDNTPLTSVQGQSNSAFSNAGGTARSFKSLASKFGASFSEDSSSIGSLDS